ncbi:MAG: hypothetical protein NZO58_06480 [Gemmataceae bacterium]|nr:hypothetical protein [Gemmataceae bacterium]
MKADRSTWPLLVWIGLWGLPTRRWAWLFVWLSLGLSAGSVALGFFHPLAFVGALFVIAALWYYLAIRWVDKHSSWD